MVTSRLIRTAVSLCLTVAFVLPPPALGLERTAIKETQADPTCPGCGHCKVKSPGDYCGCCSHAKRERATRSSTHSPAIRHTARHLRRETLSVCMCGLARPPATPPAAERQIAKQISIVPVKAMIVAPVTKVHQLGQPLFAGPSHALLSSPRDAQKRLCIWQI